MEVTSTGTIHLAELGRENVTVFCALALKKAPVARIQSRAE
jgi:hypothetical protein